LKDIYTEGYLQTLKLNNRQIQAVLRMKETGSITNGEYQQQCKVSDRTALRDLENLVSRQVLVKVGDKKGSHYLLKR
jgi:ATP-dependent DNA helicase RecG